MHMMESFLFRDVIAACGQEDLCYVRNDAMQSVNVTVTLEAWSLSALKENYAVNYNFFLEGGSIGTLFYQLLRRNASTITNSYLLFDWSQPVSRCLIAINQPATISCWLEYRVTQEPNWRGRASFFGTCPRQFRDYGITLLPSQFRAYELTQMAPPLLHF